jgi:hypothetical protein
MEEAPPTNIDEEVQPTEEVPQEEETPVENPTKDVKTFWNRLDEVLTELESERPIVTRPYTSSLFQPERISISSANAIPSYPINNFTADASSWHQNSETFSQFTVKFDKSLINVKSIQCLSAIIPNATLNIPDTEIYFYYYRIPDMANSPTYEWDIDTAYDQGDVVSEEFAPGEFAYYICILANTGQDPNNTTYWYDVTDQLDLPNYYLLNAEHLEHVNLLPTIGVPPEFYGSNLDLIQNRTFYSYQDLVDSLNACAVADISGNPTATIPGDVSFQYNSTLNKIVLVPTDTANYYYMGAGFADPNVFIDLSNNGQTPYKTLNLRCGFTWNGIFPNPNTLSNPFTSDALLKTILWYMRPSPPGSLFESTGNYQTANSYGNLVNTSCVKVYCNITMGSTQDSNGKAGLLSVVPMNASNLAIGYYQNNFNNPLTKVPDIISEIQIILLTESGEPFYLPNSAVVTLEMYVLYK